MRRAAGAVAFLAVAAAACSRDGGPAAVTPTPAPSYPGAAQIGEGARLASEGQNSKAADALGEAVRLLEESGSLRINNLTVVEPLVQGFGLYEPDADGIVHLGDKVVLYFEPAGFKRDFKDGLYSFDLAADIAMLDPSGKMIMNQTDFLVSAVNSRRPNREIHMSMRIDTANAVESDLVAVVTLRDRIGKKQAIAQVPFKLRIR